MNRFKKEIRKRGYKLESDYPWMPYDIKGSFGEPGHIALDSVYVDSEMATIYHYYNVIAEKITFFRSMESQNDYYG